jgi:hypothetical protein
MTAMPQSLRRVILHIIFSTKNREPWLDANVRPRCTLIWRQFAATSARILSSRAGWLIMFTLSQRCPGPFLKLN